MNAHAETHAVLDLTPSPSEGVIRRRVGRPEPRFKPDISGQLDPLRGCPQAVVPKEHLARTVLEWVGKLDLKKLEARHSSLGRHGYHPRSKLAVWVYASLIGLHHAAKVARAMETDHAFLLLSGGHRFGVSTLKDFRQDHEEFLKDAVEQTVKLAVEAGLVDPQQIAIDSVRVEADASTKSVRTAKRSKKRLEELAAVDTTALTEAERAEHTAKVEKHQAAVERCEQEGRTSHSVTDPQAGLLKFPDGAALPGHRVTVASCGSDVRFVVSTLINAAPNDFGQLEAAVTATRDALVAAGVKPPAEGAWLQVAADPGYLSEADLRFADQNRGWVDVLIHEPPAPKRGKSVLPDGFFGREDFVIHDDGSATCPAGRAMSGPYKNGDRRVWKGDGCTSCPLRARCTDGKQRNLTQNPETDRLHDAMKRRMAEPGAKERYNQRIATVEPVFSYIEDAMGYRRASSRKPETVRGEILLKVLAYNLVRLAARRPLFVVSFAFVLGCREIRLLRSWIPIWPLRTAEGGADADEHSDGVVVDPGASGGHPQRVFWDVSCVRELFSADV
jgi:transposase